MQLLAMLDDRIVFLVTRNGGVECEWVRGFVVSEKEKVVGVGDAHWWSAILPDRRSRLSTRRAEAGLEDEDEKDE